MDTDKKQQQVWNTVGATAGKLSNSAIRPVGTLNEVVQGFPQILESLEVATKSLESRLNPILRNIPTPATHTDEYPMSHESPMADHLGMQLARLIQLHLYILSITTRLDI